MGALSLNLLNFNLKIEQTELHLIQHSISFHAKGLFRINNDTYLKVKVTLSCKSFDLMIGFYFNYAVGGCNNNFHGHFHTVYPFELILIGALNDKQCGF